VTPVDLEAFAGLWFHTYEGSLRLLIIGMLGAPLLPAVQHHLGIYRVGLNLPPVVIGPAMPLALRLAAHALLESIRGWMKASLAVRTAAGFGQCVSSEIERDSNL